MFPLPVGDLLQTLQSDRGRRFTNFLRAIFSANMAELLQSKGELNWSWNISFIDYFSFIFKASRLTRSLHRLTKLSLNSQRRSWPTWWRTRTRLRNWWRNIWCPDLCSPLECDSIRSRTRWPPDPRWRCRRPTERWRWTTAMSSRRIFPLRTVLSMPSICCCKEILNFPSTSKKIQFLTEPETDLKRLLRKLLMLRYYPDYSKKGVTEVNCRGSTLKFFYSLCTFLSDYC